MVIYGYRINSIDMKEVWNKIATVQKNLNKIAFKLYHEQLGKEIAFLCDNITLNVLSREDGISIYDSAVQILNQRIDASQRARSNTLYSYNVFAHIIPYKEYTYIKIVSANQKLLKAFQIFEEYSLSEMECKDPKNKKRIIWDEICSICTKKEPFSINLSISNIDPKKECIKYPSISERAEIIARYNVQNHYLNEVAANSEIPPIRLMPFIDDMFELVGQHKEDIAREKAELLNILLALEEHPEIIFETECSNLPA